MDLFKIGFVADTKQIKDAAAALDKLNTSAKNAQGSVSQAAKSTQAALTGTARVSSALTVQQTRDFQNWIANGKAVRDEANRIAAAFKQIRDVAKFQSDIGAARLQQQLQMVAQAFRGIGDAAKYQTQIAAERAAYMVRVEQQAAQQIAQAFRGIGDAAKYQARVVAERAAYMVRVEQQAAQQIAQAFRGIAQAAKVQQSIGLERAAAEARALSGAFKQIGEVAKYQMQIAAERTKYLAQNLAAAHAEALRMNRAFDAMNRAHGQALDMNRRFDAAQRAAAASTQQVTQSTRGFGNAVNDLRIAIAALGVAKFVGGMIELSDTMTRIRARLSVVTDGTEELTAAQSRLFALAQETRSNFEDTARLYARMANSAKELGISQEQLFNITSVVNKGFQISGATVEEARGAIIQFTQAIQSGVLRGQELNSVAEQAPILFNAIIKGAQRAVPSLGVTRENFRKLAAEGKLTTEVIIAALEDQSRNIDKLFAKVPRTVEQAMTQVRNQLLQGFGDPNLTKPLIDALDQLRGQLADPQTAAAIQTLAAAVIKLTEWFIRAAGAAARFTQAAAEDAARVQEKIDNTVNPIDRVRQALVNATLAGTVYNFILADMERRQLDAAKAQSRGAEIITESQQQLALLQEQYEFFSARAKTPYATAEDIQRTQQLNAAIGELRKTLQTEAGADFFEKLNVALGKVDNYRVPLRDVGVGFELLAYGVKRATEAGEKDSDKAEKRITKLREEYLALKDGASAEEARARAILEGMDASDAQIARAVEWLRKLRELKDALDAFNDSLREYNAKLMESEALGFENADLRTQLDLMAQGLSAADAQTAVQRRRAEQIAQATAALGDEAQAQRMLLDIEMQRADVREQTQQVQAQTSDTQAVIEGLNAVTTAEEILYARQIERLQIEADLLDAAGLSTEAELKRAEAAQLGAEQQLAALERVNDLLDPNNFIEFGNAARTAFEGISGPLTGVLDGLKSLSRNSAKTARDLKDAWTAAGGDAEKYQKLVREIAERDLIAQVAAYGDIAAAAKQFFDEGTGGYKLLEKAEKAFRAVELALAIKSTAVKLGLIAEEDVARAISAAKTIVLEGAKSVASGIAAAASSMAGLPFPYNLAALAATVAALAAIGVKLSGGDGGGGSAPSGPPSLSDAAASGKGGVLGDPEKASEFITNSIDRLRDVADKQLSINQSMLTALNNIEAALGAVSGQFAQIAQFGGRQSLTLTGTAGDVALGGVVNEGIPAALLDSSALLAQVSAFVAPGTQALLTGVVQSVQDVFDNLGVALGTAVASLGGDAQTAIETFRALDLGQLVIKEGEDIDAAIRRLFSDVGAAAFAIVAEELGINLTPFRRVGEDFAETMIRVAAEMDLLRDVTDQLGMTLQGVRLSTLSELASTGSIVQPRELSPQELLVIADSLAQAAGGVEQFATNVAAFFDLTLSDSEQLARQTEQLSRAFGSVGFELPASVDELRNLVSGLDLTTEAGREAFTVITSLSPALQDMYDAMQDVVDSAYEVTTALGITDGFDELRAILLTLGFTLEQVQQAALGGTEGLRQLFSTLTQEGFAALQPVIGDILSFIPEPARQDNRAAEEAARARQRAAEEEARRQQQIAQEREGLERQLLQVQGNTAALRERELLALDESNRGLQELIWSLQDLQAEAQAAANVLETFGLGPDKVAQLTDTLTTQGIADAGAVVQGIAAGGLAALQEFLKTLTQTQVAALEPFIATLQGLIEPAAEATTSTLKLTKVTRQLSSAQNDERRSLEQRLLQLIGASAELRRRERDALQPANRSLFDYLTALEDQKALTDEVVQSYEDAASSLRDFAASMDEAFSSVRGAPLKDMRIAFDALAAAAIGGDLEAMRAIPEAGRRLVEASREQSSTQFELLRDIARAQVAAEESAVAADDQVTLAKKQFDELAQQTVYLFDIRKTLAELRGVPGFATGGYHMGGLRIVGENGPELEATGPSRIYPLTSFAPALSGANGWQRVESRLASLEATVARGNDINERGHFGTAKYTQKMQKKIDEWDSIGMPETRS